MENTLIGRPVIFKDGLKIKKEYLPIDDRYSELRKKSPWQQVRFFGVIAGISTAGDDEESWPVVILKDCCLLENHDIAEEREAIKQPLRFCPLWQIKDMEPGAAQSTANNGGLEIKDLNI